MYEQCCTIIMPCDCNGIFCMAFCNFLFVKMGILLCFDTDVKQTEVDYFGYSGRIEKIL